MNNIVKLAALAALPALAACGARRITRLPGFRETESGYALASIEKIEP